MKSLLAFPLLLLSVALTAQNSHQCGTTYEDQLQVLPRLEANLAAAKTHAKPENSAITYVPVFFHLVGDANGNGKGTIRDIFEALCTMNNDYAEHEIQFYLSPHPTLGFIDYTINNANVYDNQSNTFLMKTKKHNNAINYYVVKTAASNSGQPGEAAAYYTPSNDWIVIRKDYMNPGDNTIAHETGHFFSLMHTFFGWEYDAEDAENQPPCFESGDPTWPNAPVVAPNGQTTERQNGTNGTTAADRITDTPPDYNFGYCANGCPTYNGGARDPLGTLVVPMENNFMSYYFSCLDYEFTEGQEAAMYADLNSTSRNFLDNSFVPAATSFSTPDDLLVSPLNDLVVPNASSAVLNWNAVTGATKYLVEVDIAPVYGSSQVQRIVVDNATTLTVTGLTANKKYYWRVQPFNEYFVCAAPKQGTFRTNLASSVDDIEQVASWTLSPNPLDNTTPARIAVKAAESMEIRIRVFDAAGREVYTQNNVRLNAGDNTVDLDVSTLVNGLYFVTLENGAQREVKPLAIAR